MGSLKLAGVPLLNPDSTRILQRFADHKISLDDLRLFVGERVTRAGNSESHNYRWNTFYHYGGGSRWSFGLFLVDTETVEELEDVLSEGLNTLCLDSGTEENKFGDDIDSYLPEESQDDDSIQEVQDSLSEAGKFLVSVYVLPIRPLTNSGVSDVYVLPVVDERYLWQFRSTELADDTWAEVYESLSVDLHSDVDSDYITPIISESATDDGMVLDATMKATGRNYDPRTRKAYSWPESEIILSQQLKIDRSRIPGEEDYGIVIAGGRIDKLARAYRPEAVIVKFPRESDGIAEEGYYSNEQEATSHTDKDTLSGYTRDIYSVVPADYTGAPTDPENKTALDLLAAQLALDFYNSLKHQFDVVYAGVKPWILTGYEDFVEYRVASQDVHGNYQFQTRIHGLPYNQTEEKPTRQIGTAPLLLGKTTTSHAKSTAEDIDIYTGSTKGGESGNGNTIEAYNRFGDIDSGKWVILGYLNGSYEILQAEC